MERREFLKTAATSTVVTSLSAKLLRGATDSFPHRVRGHSGEKISLVALGGHHMGSGSEGGTALPQQARQNSLHRIYRIQESGHSPKDVANGFCSPDHV
jgi:hypothetical protein